MAQPAKIDYLYIQYSNYSSSLASGADSFSAYIKIVKNIYYFSVGIQDFKNICRIGTIPFSTDSEMISCLREFIV